jgi:hypothetical protein
LAAKKASGVAQIRLPSTSNLESLQSVDFMLEFVAKTEACLYHQAGSIASIDLRRPEQLASSKAQGPSMKAA